MTDMTLIEGPSVYATPPLLKRPGFYPMASTRRPRIRALAPLAGALRRLRIVGGVGIVFGYSRDEPASGERLQVRLQRVSNRLGIDLPVVHVERKGF